MIQGYRELTYKALKILKYSIKTSNKLYNVQFHSMKNKKIISTWKTLQGVETEASVFNQNRSFNLSTNKNNEKANIENGRRNQPKIIQA